MTNPNTVDSSSSMSCLRYLLTQRYWLHFLCKYKFTESLRTSIMWRRVNFKRGFTVLNLELSFYMVGFNAKVKEKDIDTRLTKAWRAVDKLSIIWKSDLTDKMKRSFFQATVVSILLYGCTLWTLTKRTEKKLDGNHTRMLPAILKQSWEQQPTKHQLLGHLPPITKTIQVRWIRHAGHCRGSRDELISDVFLWTPTYGRAKAGRPARIYIQQLCEDMEGSPDDLPVAREGQGYPCWRYDMMMMMI